MARGLNMVVLIGNVGADATLHKKGDSAVATVNLATNEVWKDRTSGEKQERAEWHRLKFFGKLAEVVGEYVTQGTKLWVRGRLRTDKYTDKEGIERYSTEIIVDEMQMLGGGRQGAPEDAGDE
ncbi:MAG: single-stranded DNA-binding protein [Burkholderiales bacterium]|nr:single-stranded DNA-binding protein [Burkholderiales bacterium]